MDQGLVDFRLVRVIRARTACIATQETSSGVHRREKGFVKNRLFFVKRCGVLRRARGTGKRSCWPKITLRRRRKVFRVISRCGLIFRNYAPAGKRAYLKSSFSTGDPFRLFARNNAKGKSERATRDITLYH